MKNLFIIFCTFFLASCFKEPSDLRSAFDFDLVVPEFGADTTDYKVITVTGIPNQPRTIDQVQVTLMLGNQKEGVRRFEMVDEKIEADIVFERLYKERTIRMAMQDEEGEWVYKRKIVFY